MHVGWCGGARARTTRRRRWPSAGLLARVCELLHLDEAALVPTLTMAAMLTRGELIERNCACDQALGARDTMARELYRRVFGWIVSRINVLLVPPESVSAKIA